MSVVPERMPDSTTAVHPEYDHSPDFMTAASSGGFQQRVLAVKPTKYNVDGTALLDSASQQFCGLGPNGTLIFLDASEQI
ncbi:unnamed protein product [Gongylonema pulchrum]|uniref:SGL domain-containing protein n=1 Tax=Gongylonema pulchrum TaxID=637853 RepID=A0A183CZ24_9BILA|nr:unnamed protein product [Gongylonema pulchrum]